MEINNVTTLAKHILQNFSVDSEDDINSVSDLIKQYGNARERNGIESEFHRCFFLIKKAKDMRNRNLRGFVMDYDDDDRTISLHTFNKFFWAVFDEAKRVRNHTKAAQQIQDYMFSILGRVTADRRFTFLKD